MNCVHPSPIYMCVCVGRGRGGDIRCHQIDLLFCARIPCYMRNITRLTFFSVPDSVRSQQISQQILVNSTESGEKSNQKVQQIFTNLVSGPVSRKEKISRPLYQASQDQMIPGKEEKQRVKKIRKKPQKQILLLTKYLMKLQIRQIRKYQFLSP